jgi:hypothetical protein
MKGICGECEVWSRLGGLGICEVCMDEWLDERFRVENGEEVNGLNSDWNGMEVKKIDEGVVGCMNSNGVFNERSE